MSTDTYENAIQRLQAREKQLAYELAWCRADLRSHAVSKRVDECDMAISAAKQFLRDSYEWHQKVWEVKDTLGIDVSYSENHLEHVRAKVRLAINRRKRALRALNKIKFPAPVEPKVLEPEHPKTPESSPKDTKKCDIWCEFCCQCPHIPQPVVPQPVVPQPVAQEADMPYPHGEPKWLDEWVNGLPSKTDVLNSPPPIYRMSEDTKDKLATIFGWTGREKEYDNNYWFEEWAEGMPEIDENDEHEGYMNARHREKDEDKKCKSWRRKGE